MPDTIQAARITGTAAESMLSLEFADAADELPNEMRDIWDLYNAMVGAPSSRTNAKRKIGGHINKYLKYLERTNLNVGKALVHTLQDLFGQEGIDEEVQSVWPAWHLIVVENNQFEIERLGEQLNHALRFVH